MLQLPHIQQPPPLTHHTHHSLLYLKTMKGFPFASDHSLLLPIYKHHLIQHQNLVIRPLTTSHLQPQHHLKNIHNTLINLSHQPPNATSSSNLKCNIILFIIIENGICAIKWIQWWLLKVQLIGKPRFFFVEFVILLMKALWFLKIQLSK